MKALNQIIALAAKMNITLEFEEPVICAGDYTFQFTAEGSTHKERFELEIFQGEDDCWLLTSMRVNTKSSETIEHVEIDFKYLNK